MENQKDSQQDPHELVSNKTNSKKGQSQRKQLRRKTLSMENEIE